MIGWLLDRWYRALPDAAGSVGRIVHLVRAQPDGTRRRVPQLHLQGDGARAERELRVVRWEAVRALAGGDEERALQAGDDVFVELDLDARNLPDGAALTIGPVILGALSAPRAALERGSLSRRGRRRARRHDRRQLGGRSLVCRVLQPGTLTVGDAVYVKNVGIRFQP